MCDWYLEAIKPAMKDPNRAARAGNVLASVLDGTLRLLHPMIPFITDVIWWRLNDVCPRRGIPDRLECPPSERLIKAAWPEFADVSEAGEEVFARLQEIVQALRNLRSEHKVDPKRTITVTISTGAAIANQIEDSRELI